MESLTTYITSPELLTADVVEELADMVERNPSFQAARILYLRGLYELQDARFGAELRKAALLVPDRTTLFRLFEEERMSPVTAVVPAAEPQGISHTADRTQSLIESFLEQQPDPMASRKPHPVDASVDYMAYLMQQPDALPEGLPDAEPEEELPDEDDDDFFDDEETPPTETTAQQKVQPVEAKNSTNDLYFTETLAHIYIKQGKYTKAIEIIRRLSLNVPEKNRYFADQIRFLEKLILNERASNNENQQK